MPEPAYMTIEGKTQGNISNGALGAESVGRDSKSAHENEILVQSYKHSIMTPKDPITGQPKGRPVHEYLTVTKPHDKSSPLLYNALCSGEELTKVEIKFMRTSPDGKEEHYFTTKLEGAIVSDIQEYMPNYLELDKRNYPVLEEVTFSYKKIEWTHESAGTAGAYTFGG
jgi:type VI secretion system secreted protein Hcp